MTSIYISKSVVSIKDHVFSLCSKLTSIDIYPSVRSIISNLFERCSLLSEIKVDLGKDLFLSEDGILFDSKKTSLICFPSEKTENTRFRTQSLLLGNMHTRIVLA